MTAAQRESPVASPGGVACPMCGSDRTRATGYRADEFRLMACAGCDLQFFDPMKNPGAEWYESNYRFRDLLEVDTVNWNHRQFLTDRRIPVGSVLDVGCGTGSLLAAAQGRGWKVVGLDFNEAGVRAARERLGVETVYPWTLAEFIERRPGEQFDAVTAFEVLEHLDEPAEFLRQSFGLVRPGGFFAVSVPFRDRWPRWHEAWDEPPHHMTRWSKQALLGALATTGFQAVDVRTGWIASARILMGKVRFGLVQAELARASGETPDAADPHVRRAAAMHRVKSAVFGAVGLPVDLAVRMAGGTGIDMYVLARRPP